ncbi:hypothetical protein PQZ64_gp59 [Klebsiella phage vB_KpnM_IME346]|uniref:Ead/Ea22-like family protein n=1 Tax=Klebsiella phage vB_KpnM_IME346 TaxID=2562174 RepID=A0A4D6DS64_9CAUD|nr:hypothetical protein PQZ64_gp59 [Klebsiella phage vB_KpnM_IME346]QBZ68958.1 hypothetical protein [Klebsiella phage vB_KpnM_IME346]
MGAMDMEALSYCQLMERCLAAEARVMELESGKVGNALLERKNHHIEVVGKLTERIAELTAENVALEKARAKADVYDMLRDDYGLREIGVGLADFVDWQAKRITELESRTVKLPSLNPEMFNGDVMFGYHKAQKEAVEFCAAVGIKVETK